MHLFIGLPQFLSVAAYLVIFGFFWRTLAARLSDTTVGQAMAFIY